MKRSSFRVGATVLVLSLAVASSGCGGHKKKLAMAQQKSQLGSTKLGEGDAEGALADLSQAHKLDPDNPDITNLLGLAYWAKARVVSDESLKLEAEKYALLSFKQKGKETPGDWHNNLGALYIDMKRYPDAVVQLEMAWHDPEYRTPERPLNNLSEASFQQNKCVEAVTYAQNALKIQPRFCMAFINEGKALDCLKKNQDAYDAFAHASVECPEYPEPYLRAGMAALRLGKKAEAVELWKKAKKADPDGATGKQADDNIRMLGKQ